MFKEAIEQQMKKWNIKNPNQLSKLAGIDYRTACKAVNTDGDISQTTIAKIAKVFGFTGWLDFRKHVMKNKA